jgi:hypothetical protein
MTGEHFTPQVSRWDWRQEDNTAGQHCASKDSRFVLASPTGGLIIRLSTPGLPGMATTAAPREYLLHVVSEHKPDLPAERHFNMEIGEKHSDARSLMIRVFIHALSPFV